MSPLFIVTRDKGRAVLAHVLHPPGSVASRDLVIGAWRALDVSVGHAALDCVEAPESVQEHLGRRARRLIRQAQVSAW